MKTLGVLVAIYFLTACAALLPENLYVQKGAPIPATEGLAVLKFYGHGNDSFISYEPKHSIQLFFQKVGSPQYTTSTGSIKGYRAVRLPEGEWYLAAAAANDIYLNIPVEKGKTYSEETALPFKPFTIKAGETICLGDIELKNVLYEQVISGASKNVGFAVFDKFEEAKSETQQKLMENAPGFSPLKKSLIESK